MFAFVEALKKTVNTINTNFDKPVGTVSTNYNSCGACGPANNVQANCNNFGPEWNYNGSANCGSCNLQCIGSLCIPGANATCKKYQYLGSTADCCLGKKPDQYPQKTCDPNITANSNPCYNTLKQYCTENVFSEICDSWGANYPKDDFLIKKNYCANKLVKNKNCRNWAINSKGQIDDLMIDFCQKNPKDDLCNCINSEIPCPNKFDFMCLQSGAYETSDMIRNQCPNVLNCTQFLSLSPGAKAIATNVQQNCTSTVSGNTETKTNSAGSPGIMNIVPENTGFLYIILIFILFTVIILIIIKYKNQKININKI